MPLITYRKALNDALAEEIIRDENVVVIGEEVTEGLWKRFGDKRLVDAPISEAGFIGLGIGASMMGVRPVLELMFWSFAYVAYDQIVNNAGCVRYMSGRADQLPDRDPRAGERGDERGRDAFAHAGKYFSECARVKSCHAGDGL